MVLIELLETASGDEETVRMNLWRLKPNWRRTRVHRLQNNEGKMIRFTLNFVWLRGILLILNLQKTVKALLFNQLELLPYVCLSRQAAVASLWTR